MSSQDRHQTDVPDIDLGLFKREFGEAVKARRQEQGLSQAELGEEWKYGRSTIAGLESGSQVSKSLYRRARKEYAGLPEIPGFADGEETGGEGRNEDSEEMVFDRMLNTRTRPRSALMGTWHALWETEVEGEKVFNSEVLQFTAMLGIGIGVTHKIMIKNPQASNENPIGGYAWRAECRFIDGDCLLGIYISTEDANSSKGALQMKVHVGGGYMQGQWIGESYDGEFGRGHVVFCREKDKLVRRMEIFTGKKIDFEFNAE